MMLHALQQRSLRERCCCADEPCRAGALVPKTPSTALYLELLDAAGAPTWMARDVQQLVQVAKSRQPGQQQQHSTQVATEQQRQQQQQQGAGAVSDSGGDSDGEQSEGGQETKAQQEDDVDVDTLLAMAAAEVRLGVPFAGSAPDPWRQSSCCASHWTMKRGQSAMCNVHALSHAVPIVPQPVD
jgi:hypothetical protein